MLNTKTKISIKIQVIAAFVATIFAIALPQLFHIAGRAFGLGTGLGEIFLPMHLPVIMVGIFAGPYVGAIVGIASPIISTLLTGMPNAVMLPFMMAELFAYGLSAGMLRNTSMPTLAKVGISQLAGRALRAICVMISVYLLGNSTVAVASIWMSIATGAIGIILQWIVIPPVVKSLEDKIH